MLRVIDFIYDHFDKFSPLLDASYGTRFQNFVAELVELEVEYTCKYMKAIGCQAVHSDLVTEEFLHIITNAYFSSMFKIVRHNMKKEDDLRYVKMLSRYPMAGFDTIFSPEKYPYPCMQD